MRNSATRIVPLSDTAAAQSGELLKAGPVLLVIDHRDAIRSAQDCGPTSITQRYRSSRMARHLRRRIVRRDNSAA
jgi:hypothetical protein